MLLLSLSRIRLDALQVKIDLGPALEQVDLVDEQDFRFGEDGGILRRFIIPLGDRQHDNLPMFAQFKSRGTHQITDILNKNHVQTVQRQLRSSHDSPARRTGDMLPPC